MDKELKSQVIVGIVVSVATTFVLWVTGVFKGTLQDSEYGSILPLYLDGDEKAIYDKLSRRWVLCDGKVLDLKHPHKLANV